MNITPKMLARMFHVHYERIARETGWNTQDDCKVDFDDLPELNKATMVLTCKAILDDMTAPPPLPRLGQPGFGARH